MFIDILFLLSIIAAIIKGYSKGLIVAVFSFAAIIIGLAAAIKFSSVVANWLNSATNLPAYWMPFLSFSIVIIGVIIVVRLGAKIVEKTVQLAMMGWLNKLGGIILFASIYISILSVVLFFFDKMHILKPETISSSASYWFVKPWAPKIIAGFGYVIPFFQNTFHQLESFFSNSHPII